MVLLIELVVVFGKGKHCIIWIGIEERTDLASVIHPPKFNIFYFHMLSLVVIEFRIGWKSNDDGLRFRIGNPKYLPRLEVQEISKIEHIW